MLFVLTVALFVNLLGAVTHLMERAQVPDYLENPYLQTLSRSHKLILRLLRQRKYRTVRMLFAVKDKLG